MDKHIQRVLVIGCDTRGCSEFWENFWPDPAHSVRTTLKGTCKGYDLTCKKTADTILSDKEMIQ